MERAREGVVRLAKFGQGEGRDWAKQNLRGVAGCVSPTFTNDLRGLNEAAIRHDVRLEKELGFAGILLVSETGTTPAEMREFVDITVDAAGGDLITILQASEQTLQDNIDLIAYAENAGADLVLPSFPLMFHPQTEDEVYDFFKGMADSTSMGMIVFAIHLWNFGRLHPSTFSPRLIRRLVDDCPNVVAIKNEIGHPTVAGVSEVFERFNDEVVVTDPMEHNAPAWTCAYDMQFLGTSNYEYAGSAVPRMFDLLQDRGTYDEAMELYWQMHPARLANLAVMGEAIAGTSLVHRLAWKYQNWLQGFNGGPIRFPQGRLNDGQMARLRSSLVAAGLPVTDDPDERFFVGRLPSER
jgi:dihydrodipicolinate synthase/N-acetylneuraminate lyase